MIGGGDTFLTESVFVRLAGFSFERLAVLDRQEYSDAIFSRLHAEEFSEKKRRALREALDRERFDDSPELREPARRNRLLRLLRRIREAQEGGKDASRAIYEEVAAALPGAREKLLEAASDGENWEKLVAETDKEIALGIERSAPRLAEIFADPKLQEAVFLESPAALEGIRALVAGGSRNSKMRQRERTAIAYLQRFAAKNDTHSICGPVALAFLDDRGATRTEVRLVRETVRRETVFSYWAAEALRAAFEPERSILRNPAARLEEDGRLLWCRIEHDATESFHRTWMRAPLPSLALDLYRGQTPADTDPEEIESATDDLIANGVLRDRRLLPTGLTDPLKTLADRAADGPAREEITALRASVETFAAGDLATRVAALTDLGARFERITGVSPQRAGGAHYADRGLIHEDASAEVDLSLSAADRLRLEAGIGALLDVAALPLDLVRENVRAWFAETFGARRISALELHRAFDKDRPFERPAATARARAIEAAIAEVRRTIAEAIDATPEAPSVSSDRLREIARENTLGPPRPGFASADLMIARREENTTWVLGEIHGFFLLPTFWLPVMEPASRDRALRELRGTLSKLAGGKTTLEAVFLHTQATDRRLPIADRDLLIAGASDRSGAIELGALDAQLTGDSIRFVHGDEEVVPISLYTVYPFLTYTSPLAPLVDDFAGRFFPRALLPQTALSNDAPQLFLDRDIVFRRRSRTRSAAEVLQFLSGETDAARFTGAHRLQRNLRFGPAVFVSIPGEPKPIFLSFQNPFLIDLVARAVGRVAAETPVRFVEMLPGRDDLLLQGPDGPRTFEIRAGVFRAPQPV